MLILYLCLGGLVLGVVIRFIAGLFVRIVKVPVWLKLLGVAVAMVAVYAALIKFHDLEAYLARRHWPVTQGTIVSSAIAGDQAPHPVIGFQYTVGDSTYVDTTYLNTPGFGNQSRHMEVAEAWLHEYPTGRLVNVSYDSSNPRHGFISLTPPWTDYFIPGLGVFCATLAGFLLACPRSRKSR